MDAEVLQQIRDKILGVTGVEHGGLASEIYLQEIRDAILSVTDGVFGCLNEAIYLQEIRDAVLGVTATPGTYGNLASHVYLQQIRDAYLGVTSNPQGSQDEGIYLDEILSVAAPPGATYKTPDQVTGLTGWWDASDSGTMFTDAGVTPVAADGNAVYRITDKSGGAGNRYFDQSTLGNRPLYKVNRQNGKSGLLFDGTDDIMASIAISNFITAAIGYFFLVIKPLGAILTNQVLMSDASGFFQLLGGDLGNGYKLHHWDGNYDDTPQVDTPATQVVLIGCWHVGGNLYIQKNNGTVSAPVASGNTTNLAPALNLFSAASANTDLYEVATYNQTIADVDRESLNLGLMQKWGI